MIWRRPHQRLQTDERGTTIVEFAIVAPVLCLLIVGAFDVSHTLYMQASLEGIVQKTARDSTLESNGTAAQQAELDAEVTTQVKLLSNTANVQFTRRFYRTFSAAAAAHAETWTDTDHDGTCDNGEPYEDANNNNTWDADGGDDGQGGAKDRTLYTVTVTYRHLLPIYGFIGGSNMVTMKATTVLENQPYADQGVYAPPTVRNCPEEAGHAPSA